MNIVLSDVRKIQRALTLAEQYHRATDEANAARHAASAGDVIYSPLTVLLRQEIDRISRLIDQLGKQKGDD